MLINDLYCIDKYSIVKPIHQKHNNCLGQEHSSFGQEHNIRVEAQQSGQEHNNRVRSTAVLVRSTAVLVRSTTIRSGAQQFWSEAQQSGLEHSSFGQKHKNQVQHCAGEKHVFVLLGHRSSIMK